MNKNTIFKNRPAFLFIKFITALRRWWASFLDVFQVDRDGHNQALFDVETLFKHCVRLNSIAKYWAQLGVACMPLYSSKQSLLSAYALTC